MKKRYENPYWYYDYVRPESNGVSLIGFAWGSAIDIKKEDRNRDKAEKIKAKEIVSQLEAEGIPAASIKEILHKASRLHGQRVLNNLYDPEELEKEEWTPMLDYGGKPFKDYYVSNLGRIGRIPEGSEIKKPKTILKASICNNGYLHVSILGYSNVKESPALGPGSVHIIVKLSWDYAGYNPEKGIDVVHHIDNNH